MANKEIEDISSLLSYASKFKLLTREEETDLIARAHAGEKAAYDELIVKNLRLVINIANNQRYLGRGLDLYDLIIEGTLGVKRAAEKFDSRTGNKFSTYATCWIHQKIRRALDDKSKLVRIPIHIHGDLNKVQYACRELSDHGSGAPTSEELSAKTGFTVEQVKTLGRYLYQHVSLDQTVGDENVSLGNLFGDRVERQPEEMVNGLADTEYLNSLLSKLEPIDRELIILKYGLLSDHKERKDKELAAHFGMKVGEVKKKHQEILRTLKSVADSRRMNLNFTDDQSDSVNVVITSISNRLRVIELLIEFMSQRYENRANFKSIALLVRDLPAVILTEVERDEADKICQLLYGIAKVEVINSG